MEKNQKPKCFIIMPFGGFNDSYYEEIYIPAILEAGYIPQRADDIYRPGNIMHDIWDYTKNCDIILADLTNKNPNVFYELGLAHAITKPAILITSSMDDVPFDLRSLRVIEYDKNFNNWGFLLKEKIIYALKETNKNPKAAIPPTFLEVNQNSKIEVSEFELEFTRLRNEVDYLIQQTKSKNIPNNTITSRSLLTDMIQNYFKLGKTYDEIFTTILNYGLFDIQTVIDVMNENELL